MKRWLSLLLLACCLPFWLFGCQQTVSDTTDAMAELYYRLADLQYDGENGVISSELRALSSTNLKIWLNDYLQGPNSAELQSPFPRATRVTSVEQKGTAVAITMSEEYAALSGVDLTIANACLTLTLTQFPEIETVNITVEDDSVIVQEGYRYTASDFASYDYASRAVEISLKVYFPDRASRYLLSTTQTVEAGQTEQLPDYLIDCLLAGPSDDYLAPVMPEGTQLLGSEIENGVCTLNFNQAFYDNRPQSESQERVLIYAIVNSVSELSAVDAVRFLVEGEKIGLYYYLDLSLDYTFDENAVGPVRTAVNEFDGTVYLQGADPDYLAAVPLRVHQTANQTAEEALMEALLNVTPPTGMTNPIPSDTELLEISIVGYCCYVNLSSEFDSASAAAVRSIVLSLSALQDVTTVQIEVEGEPYTSIMGASSTWTYPNP